MNECKPLRGGQLQLQPPAGRRGKVVQVDPITPTLKAPGSERLKLNCDILLPTCAFRFNFRRYTVPPPANDDGRASPPSRGLHPIKYTPEIFQSMGRGLLAGAYTRPLFGST